MTHRIVTRQDGTRRVVELSRSGRVKADWPACDSCEGTGVGTPTTCTHCGVGIRRASDPTPWVHVTTGNSFCDVACADDAVWLRGSTGRTEANPGHDWDEYARGAMTCRRCGLVWSDTCPTECDGVMPY